MVRRCIFQRYYRFHLIEGTMNVVQYDNVAKKQDNGNHLGINVLHWLQNSPYLNRMENIWWIIGQMACERALPTKRDLSETML
ncbi:hypothetical protein NPIL_463531 [Nephila pilipes]|uniref:Uncharacterized protein n=1 Tax=Nephila pilipes TaxID=299642 RepID=A0A8X6UKK8_NEPPI|nr:hypothetical protein NPIL_463531 [Nephila pilipes]